MDEDVYIDLDHRGRLVSMTLEHAKERANLREVAFEEVAVKAG